VRNSLLCRIFAAVRDGENTRKVGDFVQAKRDVAVRRPVKVPSFDSSQSIARRS